MMALSSDDELVGLEDDSTSASPSDHAPKTTCSNPC
jgi:hypothetical protein